ncbi:hypothetical protein [Rhizobium miluonense]|uniref:Lipoprotein n=1 Tax=Rhizobium miluonense TaxID=411945 RepID=A0ABU1T0I5_9HYPH|nr:hypothetical protein [Rhizobium miluonense]MDR6904213.1 hypothetical protein [Rhizobium miluonense]
MTRSWHFKANLVMLASLGIVSLAGCSDETLAERKKACNDYVNYGVLREGEKPQCVAEEQTFRKAASELVAADLQQMYPALVNDAKAISASATKADLTGYRPLPLRVKDPTFFDNSDEAATSWPAMLDLENVTLNAPNESNRQWRISGNRAGDSEAPWGFDLDGFRPAASSQIENLCTIFNSLTTPGCKARVYVKNSADADSDLGNLVAVAVEFTPPPKDEAYRTLLENEMSRWTPKVPK